MATNIQRISRCSFARHTAVVVCGDKSVGLSDTDFLVPGWERPLYKKLLSVIAPDKPTTADLLRSIPDYLQQVVSLDGGRSHWAGSFRNLSEQFDVGDGVLQSGRPVTIDSLVYNLLRDSSSACRALPSETRGNEQKVAQSECKEELPRATKVLLTLLYPSIGNYLRSFLWVLYRNTIETSALVYQKTGVSS